MDNSIPDKQAYGVIPIKITGDSFQILLVKENDDNRWSFPKGRPAFGETKLNTAIRKLKQETNLSLKSWILDKDSNMISGKRRYVKAKRNGKTDVREAEFYVGEVDGEVKLQRTALNDYKWLGIDEVEKQMNFEPEIPMWMKMKEQIHLCIQLNS